MRRTLGIAMMTALVTTSAATAQLTQTKIATTTPCDPHGLHFTYLGYPHVNMGGDVVFKADACTVPECGLYVALNSGGRPVLSRYVSRSTTNLGFQWFFDYPSINDSRTIGFKASYGYDSGILEGLYTATATGAVSLVAQQDLGGNGGFHDFDQIADERIRINSQGKVLFGANMNPDASHEFSTSAVWLWKPGSSLAQVVRQGDPIEGGIFGGANAWDFNSDGTISLLGSYTDADNNGHIAHWRGQLGALHIVVASPIPDWGYFPTTFINGRGDIAIQANSQFAPLTGSRDLWAVQTAAPAARVTMAQGGDNAPGLNQPFFYFCSVSHSHRTVNNFPSINYGASAIFHADTVDPVYGNCAEETVADGFWSWNGAQLSAEAVRGQATSTWSGPLGESFDQSDPFQSTVAINDLNQFAFLANVRTATTTGMALFARSGGTHYRIDSAYNGEYLWYGQGAGIAVASNDNAQSGYGRLTNCGYLVYRHDYAQYQQIVLARMGQLCVLTATPPIDE